MEFAPVAMVSKGYHYRRMVALIVEREDHTSNNNYLVLHARFGRFGSDLPYSWYSFEFPSIGKPFY